MAQFRSIMLLSAACIAAFLDMAPAQAAEKNIRVGTAGITGVYYPAGGAICRMVSRGRKEHGVRCAVESTGGSISNLESIHNKDLDMGVVQSDILYYAYTGSEIFADAGSDKKLRVLFSLHSEPFTIIARQSAKIDTLDDLKGKRVYIGAPGSGMRATMEDLMVKKGWNNSTFTSVADIKANDQEAALCEGKIDALVYAGGHPNGAVQQITSACPTHLVDVSGPEIDKLIAERPFYTRATIAGGMYNNNPQETKTFGVKAMLVASDEMEDDVAYEVVKAVFENLDNFKTLHPVFATLDAKRMATDTDITPLHPGAQKYFKEKGLIP